MADFFVGYPVRGGLYTFCRFKSCTKLRSSTILKTTVVVAVYRVRPYNIRALAFRYYFRFYQCFGGVSIHAVTGFHRPLLVDNV